MQSHLRIGILTEDYGYGGVQRHSTGVIQALRAKGHHVEALCFRDIAPMQIAIDAGVAPVLVVTPKIFSKQTARAVSDAGKRPARTYSVPIAFASASSRFLRWS